MDVERLAREDNLHHHRLVVAAGRAAVILRDLALTSGTGLARTIVCRQERAVGPRTVLLVEGEGRLDEVTIDGTRANDRVLASDLDGPAVTLVGE